MRAPASLDEVHLGRALELAERGRGWTAPNPVVGCVLVRSGRVVGEGWHRRFGGAHAEVEALHEAGRAARGAVCYVTLEPCNHAGKTGPCAEALRAAGVAGVVYGLSDPAEGKGGARRLRRAGMTVRKARGAIATRCRRANAGWLMRVSTGHPLVTVKIALTVDGRIATAGGKSAWLTSPRARAHARALRGRFDAMLTGVQTVLADDPRLTFRSKGGRTPARQPLRVILDSSCRTPPDSRILHEPGIVVVATTRRAPRVAVQRLQRTGAEVIVLPSTGERVALEAMLAHLATRGVNDLMVEGGGILNGSLLGAGLVDRALLFVAPKILGADARSAFEVSGPSSPDLAWQLEVTGRTSLGPDLLIEADLIRESRTKVL